MEAFIHIHKIQIQIDYGASDWGKEQLLLSFVDKTNPSKIFRVEEKQQL